MASHKPLNMEPKLKNMYSQANIELNTDVDRFDERLSLLFGSHKTFPSISIEAKSTIQQKRLAQKVNNNLEESKVETRRHRRLILDRYVVSLGSTLKGFWRKSRRKNELILHG